jgi:ketosteroid isomerase-like protein
MAFVRAAFIVFVLLLSVPQVTQANGTEDVRSPIEAVNMEFSAAFNRGDAAGVAGLYTEDGSLLPPGENIVSGRSNIEAYWKSGVDAGLSNLQLTGSEVEAHGPLAYEVGEFSFEMPGSDGGRESTWSSGRMSTGRGNFIVTFGTTLRSNSLASTNAVRALEHSGGQASFAFVAHLCLNTP